MRRLLRWIVGTILVLLLAAAATAWWGYSALTRPQPFYRQALAADPVQASQHSAQLESRVSTLVSEAQLPGKWQSTITVDELNGWLATKLPESYPDLLPEYLRDPRVAIEPSAFKVAVQTKIGSIDTVVTVVVDLFVTDKAELAVEMVSAHAGALPLPVTNIVRDVKKTTEESDLPVRWTQNQGRPVMLLNASLLGGDDDELRKLERIELADGALYLEGTTAPAVEATASGR